jgi:DNA-directed RNA polymerase sigma subunit (sigma70/sigma32)
LPAPPGRALKDLAGLDDREVLGIVRLLPRASERRAAVCDLRVTRHHGLVRSCMRPYLGGPEPAEDLMQVGYVGLLKGISNFDPTAGARSGPGRRRIPAIRSLVAARRK